MGATLSADIGKEGQTVHADLAPTTAKRRTVARLPELPPVWPTVAPNAGDKPLVECLAGLYREQLRLDPDSYLASHASPACVRNQVKTFRWYESRLPTRGRVLDWGCAHGPDSCLLRLRRGDAVELHACDLAPPDRYAAFRAFARPEYRCLTHPVALPYEDDSFDAVIASGVLEHVAFEADSLKEVWRVLRPGGVLVVSYLPNRLSVREWWLRRGNRPGHHLRLYSPGGLRRLWLRNGFVPDGPVRQQTFLWENLAERLLPVGPLTRGLNRLASAVLPVHLFASVLCGVARKVPSL